MHHIYDMTSTLPLTTRMMLPYLMNDSKLRSYLKYSPRLLYIRTLTAAVIYCALARILNSSAASLKKETRGR